MSDAPLDDCCAPFLEASTQVQVARLARLARRALQAWSLGDARLEPVKYRENAVFSVTSPSGERYALRVHRSRYRSDAEIHSEVAWMQALGEVGVRTPEVVPNRAGEVVTVAGAEGVPEARQCVLFRWVPSSRLGSLEQGVQGKDEDVARVYRTLGGMAALVHDHGARWPRPAGFTRPAWDTETLVGEHPAWGRFWELACLSREQLDVLFRARERVREELAAFGQTADRFGLIHGDFLPENLLLEEEGVRLIDFDDCGESWYGFELATALFPLLHQANVGLVCRAYLEGYRAVRALPDAHLARLPAQLMARALSYLGWPAGRPEIEEGQKAAPFLGDLVTGLAGRYLAGEPLGLPD